jgi:hypothetical protein
MILSNVLTEIESSFAASQREMSCILLFSIDLVLAVSVSMFLERQEGLYHFRKRVWLRWRESKPHVSLGNSVLALDLVVARGTTIH